MRGRSLGPRGRRGRCEATPSPSGYYARDAWYGSNESIGRMPADRVSVGRGCFASLPRRRGAPVNRVVDAPAPPYYAVIAPAELRDDARGYPELAARLVELAKRQPGFLGIEAGPQRGFALAVSYWASLEAIEAWRVDSRHVIAKQQGMSDWFAKYVTRIAKVERVY